MAELSGYLAAEESPWRVPVYAQTMLWLKENDAATRLEGARGAFELDVADDGVGFLDLVWGVVDGPLLARWPVTLADDPVTLGWRGMVAVGGFVERLHAFEARGLELVVAELEGALLPPNYPRLPTLEQMRRGVFVREDSGDSADVPEHTYTLVALADSIHAEYLHHAMISELAVDCFTMLGPADGMWHEIVGLPLLVETVSLLAPG